MPARLHLVDGTFELFRAFYGPRPEHTAPDGQPVKATLGVVTSLLALLSDKNEQATHVAIAFDNPIESFRNELFSGYKTGDGIDPVLRAQFDLVEQACHAAGFVVWRMVRWEADDALATAAVRFRDDFEQVRILTPDKDLGQVVSGRKIVQVDRIRQREIDEDGVRQRRGVAPGSIPDWLALVGDDADGIPGLPGFGEKAAATLLSVYPRLEAIPERAADWTARPRGADTLAATLRERRDDALLYRELATLRLDVPLEEGVDELRWRGVRKDEFAAFCERIGAPRLLGEMGRVREG